MEEKKVRIFGNSAVLFLGLELILQFLNSDKYLQISGMYWALLASLLCATVQLFLDNVTINKRNFPVLVLIACVLVSALGNISNVQSGYFLSYLLLLGMVFLFFSVPMDRRQCSLLYFAYAVSGAIISLLIIFFGVRYYDNDPSRITIQIVGTLIDPNYLAAYLLGPCLLWLQFMLQQKQRKHRVLSCVFPIILFIGIIKTGSRGAFVALFLGVAVFCWKAYGKIDLKGKLKLSCKTMWGIVAALVAMGIIIILLVPRESVVRLLNVFNWKDGSNSRRFVLWGQALQAIVKAPFGGQGICDTAVIIEQAIGVAAPSHCLFLELWLHLGIFGLAAMGFLVYPMLVNKHAPMATAMCTVSLVSGIFISSEATLFLWMNLLVAGLMYQGKTAMPRFGEVGRWIKWLRGEEIEE